MLALLDYRLFCSMYEAGLLHGCQIFSDEKPAQVISMILTKQKYTIDDLHKDMRVRVSQLSGILDTCMILLDTELLADNDVEGTLVYFGSGNTEEYTKWFQQENAITPVFFDSAEMKDGVVYDELEDFLALLD